jgi:hypothetical protein
MPGSTKQTEYVGEVGHEKKEYKTHFQIKDKKKLKGKSKGTWVKVGLGRHKLVLE